ncbi:RCC1 domain-containing protein 1-like isoform X5 [Coregonus clupeaformis]|uniref:RCC1 domain-containing protein 1-like isoform X5 n=1 Tax=Coregonus clupeaformis TaxID=59861 RepID=UPI001BE0C871|nr:RCC1 domain-containing protein 1-like isoform X5 [Coregonus clupeaformis]
MNWFGFGFNAFGQIRANEKLTDGESAADANVTNPICIDILCRNLEEEPVQICQHSSHVDTRIRTSWSRRAALHSNRPSLAFPLVPGGYIASNPPFYRPLSPQLLAVSLALGTEHAVLLTASGDIYTWGSGSHGQLGHGDLSPQEEPRAMEALLGMPMSTVAAGGWHSVCTSAGGDLYVWGWNESGQLGLPSRALRGEQQKSQGTGGASTCKDQEEGSNEVFISIQAFPALVDVTQSCEVSKISCGSRHTAAVTSTGDLYTWGWGEYGQLGQGTVSSSDEPRRVEFFKDQGLRVVDVVCGPWNTFVSAIKKDPSLHPDTNILYPL